MLKDLYPRRIAALQRGLLVRSRHHADGDIVTEDPLASDANLGYISRMEQENERLRRWLYLISHWPAVDELKEMARDALAGKQPPQLEETGK